MMVKVVQKKDHVDIFMCNPSHINVKYCTRFRRYMLEEAVDIVLNSRSLDTPCISAEVQLSRYDKVETDD